MSAIKVKLIRDEPGTCPECGETTVTEVYANECKPCRALKYLYFRHVMEWPLTEVDMRRLGLIQ